MKFNCIHTVGLSATKFVEGIYETEDENEIEILINCRGVEVIKEEEAPKAPKAKAKKRK